MAIQSNSTRCTWTNQHFSHMGRHEVFDVAERFDSHGNNTSWENNVLIRPYGSFGNANCSSGGNSEVMLVTIRVVSAPDGFDHWKLELRGGPSLQPIDQNPYYYGSPVDNTANDLGRVVDGQTISFKFDIVADYLHGAATVWRDGQVVYDNRDRPLGFHYDCNGVTDLSGFPLRMQHGVYRGWSGAMQFTSSGFRFLVSERRDALPRVASEQYAVIEEPVAKVSTGTGDVQTISPSTYRASGIWLTVEGVAARMTFGGTTPGAGTAPGLLIPVGTPPLFYPFPVERTTSAGTGIPKIKFAANAAGSSTVSYILVS
jgi:hypothetical protein